MKKLMLMGVLALAGVTAQAQGQLGVAPATKTTCPASHPVKGNIVDRGERKGERIYHVPGSRSYNQTHPERCFKDAAQAKQAGFRAPEK